METAAIARRAIAVEELWRLSTVADESDGAAAIARRARAVEELRRLSTVAESDDTAAISRRARAVQELRGLSTVAESDNTPAEEAECDHFSLRGYVAQLQKEDPKLRSSIFHREQQYDERHDSSPVFVSNYHRWNCSKCLDKLKVSSHRAMSENVSVQRDEMNDGCSISFVQILPNSRRQFSCAQQSSQGNDQSLPKTAQECNSKCIPVAEENVPEALIERSVPVAKENIPEALIERSVPVAKENVPEALIERSVPATKDIQASPNNFDVSADISNAVSTDDVQMAPIIEENATQNPCGPNSSVVPNEDENEIAQDVPNDDPNESNVCKPVSGHKGKQISSHKRNQVCNKGPRHKGKQISGQSNQVCNKGPRRASLRRNVRSDGKEKRNKSIELPDISDIKSGQKKVKKTKLLSELISTDQVGVSADPVQVDHANSVDICEGGKRKMHLDVGKDNDTPNQKVDEIQSRAVKNKAKHSEVDKVDDGSSLMNWLKITHKKVRTEKKDSEHKKLDSSALSTSCPDIVASNDMHHDFPPSVGDVGQEKVPSTTSAKHGNGNAQDNNLEQSVQVVDDLCQNESRKLKQQRFFSNGNSTVLLKRKAASTSDANDENIENSRDMRRSDDLPQMESQGTVQRCLAKVSLDKQKIQNVAGLHKQTIPNKKKKRKLKAHEKQNVIDGFPADIVELLARNQHERRLMADTNSLETCHTQPKVTQVDCAEFAAKDCPINPSNASDTNFQKSMASKSKKSLQDHASFSTEAANVNLQDVHTQKSSQCHATPNTSTSTEVPNGHQPESEMQNSFQVHALPITGSFNAYTQKLPVLDILECTQEQQTQFHRDEEVTIACTSPMFSHHQQIAEVPARSWRNNGEKKLLWDSFKTASRSSPTPSYGYKFGNRHQEFDSAPVHAYGASSNYAAHQPVIVAVDHYTKEAVSHVLPRSVPSTALTMESGRLYDQRISGHSGLYPKDPMPSAHLLSLMDSSTVPGFRNYQRANRRQMELQTQALGSQYMQHDQYNASPSTSHRNTIIENVPLTLQDVSRRQLQPNFHRPLRPHPRVGVLGSLLQQDIANWSENYGPQSGYRIGVSKGTTSLDMNRKGNYEASNSGMFSAGWNALQLGSVSSVANPDYQLQRYGTGQPGPSNKGKTVHPLDKLVRKDICVTNKNPADFTVVSDQNEYMRNV